MSTTTNSVFRKEGPLGFRDTPCGYAHAVKPHFDDPAVLVTQLHKAAARVSESWCIA